LPAPNSSLSVGLRSLGPPSPVTHPLPGGPREPLLRITGPTGWVWLLGPFALAAFPRLPGSSCARRCPRTTTSRTLDLYGLALGRTTMATPFAPRGCLAHAWRSLEMLRVFELLSLTHPPIVSCWNNANVVLRVLLSDSSIKDFAIIRRHQKKVHAVQSATSAFPDKSASRQIARARVAVARRHAAKKLYLPVSPLQICSDAGYCAIVPRGFEVARQSRARKSANSSGLGPGNLRTSRRTRSPLSNLEKSARAKTPQPTVHLRFLAHGTRIQRLSTCARCTSRQNASGNVNFFRCRFALFRIL